MGLVQLLVGRRRWAFRSVHTLPTVLKAKYTDHRFLLLGHGGFGHHSRMWGLFVDVIKELTVVLADGSIKTASESENSDLFWALRGASSSIGIVTQLKVQTFAQPPEASIFRIDWNNLPIPNGTHAISQFQNFTHNSIPSTFGGELVLNKGLEEGAIKVELFGGYWGTHDSLNATLAPYLDTMPEPDAVSVVQGTWFEGLESWVYLPLNTTNTTDSPDTFYAKSVLAPETDLLTDDAIESFVTYLAHEGFTTNTVSTPFVPRRRGEDRYADFFKQSWFVEVELYGGKDSAINKVAHDATAFPHRSTLFNFQLYASSYLNKPPYPDEGFPYVRTK